MYALCTQASPPLLWRKRDLLQFATAVTLDRVAELKGSGLVLSLSPFRKVFGSGNLATFCSSLPEFALLQLHIQREHGLFRTCESNLCGRKIDCSRKGPAVGLRTAGLYWDFVCILAFRRTSEEPAHVTDRLSDIHAE